MKAALLSTYLPYPVRQGKVRDVYDLGDTLLIIATDRISAFDCIVPNGIPDKGKILTALSLFWFNQVADRFENHLITANPPQFPQFAGRCMLVKKADVIPIECVARGYLAGSGWKEYQQSQTVCGIKLPPGLRNGSQLPEPIFTPATKEASGHDINIDFAEASSRIGTEAAAELRKRTLDLYIHAADYALSKGIIIADTKFEFGRLPDGKIILIDEILTPDSSRFWPADKYRPGREQASFDKQFVRNWLETQPWEKTPPAPRLPDDVVEGTRQRYIEAYKLLTGLNWSD
jgi:phosphoribosylaminoimidazole-succinocarboxamide synthase